MISPAIGAYLGRVYGDSLVVVLATAIALLDICFILVAVPESLPEKMRPASWGAPISWEQADPFAVCPRGLLIGRKWGRRVQCSSRNVFLWAFLRGDTLMILK